MVRALFLIVLVSFCPISSRADQATEAEFNRVLSLVDSLFAGKQLKGEDGVTQTFSQMTNLGSTHYLEADVSSSSEAPLHVIDTVASTPIGILLIEDVSGQPTKNYPITITSSGSLLVTNPDATSTFVSRECALVNQRTECTKTIRDAAGALKTIRYIQVSP